MGEIVCVAELGEEHSLSNITRHKEVCDPATGGLHPQFVAPLNFEPRSLVEAPQPPKIIMNG
jgi:hypothetical protein